MAGRLINRLIN